MHCRSFHWLVSCVSTAWLLACPVRGDAADWPMWRYDANRSSASPEELQLELFLQWVRHLPELKPAWPDQGKMQFDAAYEPVVAGKVMFVGSPLNDSVMALETESGKERWRFQADGPIRFAPAVWQGKLYVASDDGYLYCLDTASGRVHWKFRGGPADRRILGNERLISTWPARGASVVADDGTVYFAASIWPFMGVFIHALDADSGRVKWTNDGDGSTYMKQPHNADSFAAVAPQGYMTVIGDVLLVAGGRSIPACYDRRTGKLLRYQLAENGKRGGGFDVSAIGKLFFNGGAAFDLTTEKWYGDFGRQVVLTESVAWIHNKGTVKAYDLKTAGLRTTETVDKNGKKLKTTKFVMDELAQCKVPPIEVMIRAGSRLYAGGEQCLLAIDMPAGTAAEKIPAEGRIVWQQPVPSSVVRLLAADQRLFAVTDDGRIWCFGPRRIEPTTYPLLAPPPAEDTEWTVKAKTILESTGVSEGYCVAWGIGSGRLVKELVRQSKLHIVVIDADEQKVSRFRDELMAMGWYGSRVAVHAGDPLTFSLPPYFASLMVSEDPGGAGINLNQAFVQKVYQSLRPYGGIACLPVPEEDEKEFARLVADSDLAGAKIQAGLEGHLLLIRAGALPGSANWTHEHADASNTRVSKDRLVKAPLGVLWFGGPSNEGILPRHGHGPQPQVIDGRLIIEGIDMLRCMDIYTGRILWETRLPGVGVFFNNTAHQPGANASGTNYISTADGVYVAYGKACLKLDLATGKKLAEFTLPVLAGMKDRPMWGYINVVDDYLIGGAEPLYDPKLFKPVLDPKLGDDDDKKNDDDKKAEEKKSDDKTNPLSKLLSTVSRGANDNMSASKHLVVMDRHTGKVLWTATADHWFRHNATCGGGGRLYTIDRLSGMQRDRLKRMGKTPDQPSRLVVFDLATGKQLWSTDDDVFGTWLSYSARHDVVVEAGRKAADTLNDEPRGMRAYQAGTGKVLWTNKTYQGPAMIHGDIILKDTSACDLLTGKAKMRPDPITGQPVEWKWVRNYGCNTPMASEHLLTFRSGAAGYFDLCNDGGTGNFGGFRSSCTNNLIVAGGILTAADYTRTCSCLYQNQTSLALIHMPEAEMWTSFGPSTVRDSVRQLGINFGAPGDRRAANGTLWLEFPNVGGASPQVPVRLGGASLQYFRRHSSQVEGELNWVGASGVKGLTSLTISRGIDLRMLHAVESLAQAFVVAPQGQAFVPSAIGQIGLSVFPKPKEETPTTERVYTVRLYFNEPEAVQPGQRVFNVSVQGREFLTDFDIVREAGRVNRVVVREIRGIRVGRELTITFTPSRTATIPQPLLSGIEIVADGW